MSVKRVLFEQRVRTRRNASRISIAAPGDFVCNKARSIVESDAFLFPYCFDFFRRRALYVRQTDAQAVQDAPFYYLHLRRTAEQIVSVPVGYGAITKTTSAPDPVFLFSPGRVGSTLISRVLAEAKIPSVSEPDFYTQLAHPLFRAMPATLRKPFEEAMWDLGADLSAALGASPVVKLRAECARTPELFVRGMDNRTIVLFRGFESWARSTTQTFGAGPEKAVRKYLTALRCFETLSRTSRCHLMRYEDWVTQPEASGDALAKFLGITLDPEAVRRALSAHSQEGTPLKNREKQGWQEKWQGAMALWRSPAVARVRAGFDIPPIWD